MPRAGNSFEIAVAPRLKGDARTGDQVLRRARNQNFGGHQYGTRTGFMDSQACANQTIRSFAVAHLLLALEANSLFPNAEITQLEGDRPSPVIV
jgi:hypothetical protein